MYVTKQLVFPKPYIAQCQTAAAAHPKALGEAFVASSVSVGVVGPA